MKLNLIQRRGLMLPALLIAALLGNPIVSTSRAAMMTPAPATAAVITDGKVVGWGSNDYGQLAIPAAARSGVMTIAAGDFHSLALKPLPPNSPPVARCKNVTVSAGAERQRRLQLFLEHQRRED